MYLKQLAAYAYIWLVQHKPTRTKIRAVVFNQPRPDAQALMFTFNGFSVVDRFFGTVRQQDVVVQQKPVEKPRIVKP